MTLTWNVTGFNPSHSSRDKTTFVRGEGTQQGSYVGNNSPKPSSSCWGNKGRSRAPRALRPPCTSSLSPLGTHNKETTWVTAPPGRSGSQGNRRDKTQGSDVSQGGVQQPAGARGGLDPHPQGRSEAGVHTKEHMTNAGSALGATGPWGQLWAPRW